MDTTRVIFVMRSKYHKQTRDFVSLYEQARQPDICTVRDRATSMKFTWRNGGPAMRLSPGGGTLKDFSQEICWFGMIQHRAQHLSKPWVVIRQRRQIDRYCTPHGNLGIQGWYDWHPNDRQDGLKTSHLWHSHIRSNDGRNARNGRRRRLGNDRRSHKDKDKNRRRTLPGTFRYKKDSAGPHLHDRMRHDIWYSRRYV